MAKHAVLSPSSAKRWMSCPGSVILSEGVESKSSSYADEGTAAHFLAAWCLVSGDNASKHVGRTVALLKREDGVHVECFEDETSLEPNAEVLNAISIDAGMADDVQVYLDYVRDVQASTGGELLVEVAVPLDHMTFEEDAEGTSDVVIITTDEIIVIDLKFGRGVEVSAEDNPQLMMYASGARKLFDIGAEFKTIRMAISQPRVTRQPSEWSCSAGDLDFFETSVCQAAQRIEYMQTGEIEVYCEPSTEACKWCKAKAKCKALDDFVQDSISADFDSLLIDPAPIVSVETLSKKMACLDLIEDWCAAIRAAVESELLHGREVDGYKLVQGRMGARAWVHEEAAEAAMKKLKVKADMMYKKKLISPTDAEKLLKGDEKWGKLQVFITRSEGKPSVAPASDKRPALVIEPTADDFEVVA